MSDVRSILLMATEARDKINQEMENSEPQPEQEHRATPPNPCAADEEDEKTEMKEIKPESRPSQESHHDEDEDIPQPPFSWLDAHSSIAVILAGSEGYEQKAFAIQKNFLCSQSSYFRKYFERSEDSLETVIKFPDVTPETFGFVQHYLFTNEVYPSIDHLPGYEILINIWKVGHELDIEGLCNKTLEAMQHCRQITQHIPATPLLVQVWNETPEGSVIRQLLLGWAAEYMRSSEARAEFAKSLPKEVLSELVVTMSSLDVPAPLPTGNGPPTSASHSPATQQMPPPHSILARKNVHGITGEHDEGDDDQARGSRTAKKLKRHSHDGGSSAAGDKRPGRKPGPKLNHSKQAKRRSSASVLLPGQDFSSQKKLEFCSDLLARMLSGPGFWTRIVGPFKHPVVPEEDGVLDYLDKVKKPMDLGTIKIKMDNKEYKSDAEFLADVRQIFENCYTYWTKEDAMWTACAKFQKTFEEKYAEMNKWLSKMSGHDNNDAS